MQQKSVALTKRQWIELKNEATKIGISVSEYLRRLLDAVKRAREEISNG